MGKKGIRGWGLGIRGQGSGDRGQGAAGRGQGSGDRGQGAVQSPVPNAPSADHGPLATDHFFPSAGHGPLATGHFFPSAGHGPLATDHSRPSTVQSLIPNPQSLRPGARDSRRASPPAKRSRSSLPSPLSPTSSRRGVLLLLILALLAMFGLVAVAFVVLTGHAQRGAKSIERIGLTESLGDASQRTVLQQAAMQVFRGSTSKASVMGAHSLLEDMYGNEYEYGTVTAAAVVSTTPALTQLVNVTVGGLSQNYYGTSPTGDVAVTNVAAELARHVGCVLTIQSVPPGSTASQQALVGQSTRIVALRQEPRKFRWSHFPTGKSRRRTVRLRSTAFPLAARVSDITRFQANSILDITLRASSTPPVPLALPTFRPHCCRICRSQIIKPRRLQAFQTIAAIRREGRTPITRRPTSSTCCWRRKCPTGAGVIQTLPSFHRPALCRYWANNTNGLNFSVTAADLSRPQRRLRR